MDVDELRKVLEARRHYSDTAPTAGHGHAPENPKGATVTKQLG